MNKGSSKLIYFLIFVIAGSLILVNLAVNFFWLGTFIDKLEQRALGFEIARAKG